MTGLSIIVSHDGVWFAYHPKLGTVRGSSRAEVEREVSKLLRESA